MELGFHLTQLTPITKPIKRGLRLETHLYQRINKMTKPDIQEVDHRLSTHEEICAMRYEQINARLKRLEQILLGAFGTVIVLLLNNLFK